MRSSPFTRPALIAATEIQERHTRAGFDQMTLRLGLEDAFPDGTGMSVAKKLGMLGPIVIQRASDVMGIVEGGVTAGEALVREALHHINPRIKAPAQTALLRGLALDGAGRPWRKSRAEKLRAH